MAFLFMSSIGKNRHKSPLHERRNKMKLVSGIRDSSSKKISELQKSWFMFCPSEKNWKSCRMTLFLSQGDKDQFNFAPNFSFNSWFSFYLCSSIYKLSHFHLKLYSTICHLKHCINLFYFLSLSFLLFIIFSYLSFCFTSSSLFLL